MDHYANDLAQVLEALGLRDVSLFGFSTGGGEVVPYVGRHGTARVAKLGLISAVPSLMLTADANPGGLPIEVFDWPTLIVHGDDDQIVPIDVTGRAAKRLVPHTLLSVYPGAPHGLCNACGRT